jgi:hypothetical protein
MRLSSTLALARLAQTDSQLQLPAFEVALMVMEDHPLQVMVVAILLL